MRKITALDEDYNRAQLLIADGYFDAIAKLKGFSEEAGRLAHECYSGLTEDAHSCPGYIEFKNDPSVRKYLSDAFSESLRRSIVKGIGNVGLREAVRQASLVRGIVNLDSKDRTDDFKAVSDLYEGAELGKDLTVGKTGIGAGGQVLEAYADLRGKLRGIVADPSDYDEAALKDVLEGCMVCETFIRK
jgi:hypothetical protein